MEPLEEDMCITLNFTDNIDQRFFKKSNMFFKAVNLGTDKPYVQIDKYLFRGSYEDCLGTNVYFEEIAEPREVDKVFTHPTPIHLEFLSKTVKTLNLKWVKLPDEVHSILESECLNLRFLDDYQTVLAKIENDTLNIDDVVAGMKEIDGTEEIIESSIPEADHMEEKNAEPEVETTEIFDSEEDVLKRLIEPKREFDPFEVLTDNLFDVGNCDNIMLLKQLYLNHLNKQSIVKLMTVDNILNLVDLDASVADGIIEKPVTAQLSEEDKQALVTFRNFDNLSLPLKLTVLMDYLSEYKKVLKKMPLMEQNEVDMFERTPKQRYKILKSLARDIEYILLRKCVK